MEHAITLLLVLSNFLLPSAIEKEFDLSFVLKEIESHFEPPPFAPTYQSCLKSIRPHGCTRFIYVLHGICRKGKQPTSSMLVAIEQFSLVVIDTKIGRLSLPFATKSFGICQARP